MEAKICQLYTIRDSNRARGTDAVSSFPVGGKRLMYSEPTAPLQWRLRLKKNDLKYEITSAMETEDLKKSFEI